MRKKMIPAFFCFIIMAALPLISAKNGIIMPSGGVSATLSASRSDPYGKSEAETESSVISTKDSDISAADDRISNNFKILDTSSGKIISVDDKEFCYGALAYEMPPSFEEEALKAQTVALYTHFCRLRNKQKETPDKELKGADFSADISDGQFYLNDEQLKKKWGDLYNESKEKIHSAVDSVFGEVITDKKGDLIDACYHAVSSGMTENAKDIFGFDSENLIAVASPTDTAAPDYLTICSFSASEFKEKMTSLNKDIILNGNPETYIGEIKRTASGSVTETVIGNKKFTGSDIRQAFGLRSAAFEIEYSDNKFTFTVRGYGHGVGLSQWGAQGMAKQGSDYKEILNHYYQNINITK